MTGVLGEGLVVFLSCERTQQTQSYESLRLKEQVSRCLRVPIAVNRHHDHGNCYKGKHFIGVAYSSVHHHHGSMQADIVLEKELRVLHLTGNRK